MLLSAQPVLHPHVTAPQQGRFLYSLAASGLRKLKGDITVWHSKTGKWMPRGSNLQTRHSPTGTAGAGWSSFDAFSPGPIWASC